MLFHDAEAVDLVLVLNHRGRRVDCSYTHYFLTIIFVLVTNDHKNIVNQKILYSRNLSNNNLIMSFPGAQNKIHVSKPVCLVAGEAIVC